MRDIKGRFVKGIQSGVPFKKGQPAWNKGQRMPQISQNNSPHWKGSDVGYSGVHLWYKKYFPKPESCQRCGKVTEILDASNNSGKYLRDGTDWEYICKTCHRLKDKMSQGEKNGRAKLTASHIIEIRSKYIPYKYSTVRLAKEYGVSNVLIGLIVRKEIWSHI